MFNANPNVGVFNPLEAKVINLLDFFFRCKNNKPSKLNKMLPLLKKRYKYETKKRLYIIFNIRLVLSESFFFYCKF
jgi:hypothetical protein